MAKTIATLDAETDPFGLEQGIDIKPFIWGLYTGKNYYTFENTCDLVEFLKDKDWLVYAHNGGKFDYLFMLEYFTEYYNGEEEEQVQPLMVISGRLSEFKIGACTFRDSISILPVPLSAIAKDEMDYSKMHRDVRHKHMDEILKYLKSDCVYLHEAIMAFREEYETKITIAATAAQAAKELIGGMPETDEDYHDEMSVFYYGGRVTPFEIGEIKATKDKPIKFYDINSAYPTAMLDEHPYGEKSGKKILCRLGKEVIKRNKLPKDDEEIKKCFITLECETVSVNGMKYGCFPIRNKTGIDFPLTHDVFEVTGWEYLAAIKTGAIKNVKIITVYHFNATRDFKPYVEHFYAKKLEAEQKGDNTQRLFSKLFLNSYYGKYAQDSRQFEQSYICSENLAKQFAFYGSVEVGYGKEAYDIPANPDEIELSDLQLEAKSLREDKTQWTKEHKEVYKTWKITRKMDNGMTLIKSPLQKEHKFYNIATAASITGWVRAFMWESICKVERPLYCDTDSIACEDGSALPMGENLGEWDLELDNIYSCAIAGKKLYAMRSTDKKKGKEIVKTACKGVRLGASDIEKVARGDEVLYRKDSPIFSLNSSPRMLQRYVNRKDKKIENVEKRLGKVQKRVDTTK